MKSYCILFAALCTFFCTPSVLAQQCHDYACVILKVEKLLKQKQKDYQLLLDNLDSAEGYPDAKTEQNLSVGYKCQSIRFSNNGFGFKR
jgi:hypothetical protein